MEHGIHDSFPETVMYCGGHQNNGHELKGSTRMGASGRRLLVRDIENFADEVNYEQQGCAGERDNCYEQGCLPA